MEQPVGLEKIEIKLVKRDPLLEDKIMKERKIPEEKRQKVRQMLRHNCWTIKQFSELTGLAVSSIANMTRPIYKDKKLITHLDFGYPFEDLSGSGQKFIVRNEKSEKYLPK